MDTSNLFVDTFGILGIADAVLCVPLMFVGFYSYQLTADAFTCRKRPLARATMMLMALVFIEGIMVIQSTSHDAGFTLFFALLALPLSILMLYAAGPQQFHLDIARRTYRLVDGWPLFPRTRTGTADDLWGVYVNYAGNSGYIVGLRWRRDWKRRTVVDQFGSKARAEQFAQTLADRLSLEQVPPPKPLIG